MKWVMRIIGALVLVVVLAVIGLLMLPADKIAGIAADQLRKATGRDVTISGDVSMTFWPVLGVKAGELEVSNADWAKDGTMLNTSNAAIGIDAMALLSGEIRITNIEAESPTIRLESRKDGRASWLFTDVTGDAQIETATTPARPSKPVTIQKLKITDATLVYDAEGSDLVSYSGVDLSLDWPESNGAAKLNAVVRPAGKAVTIVADIGAFSQFLTGAVQPVTASLVTEAGDVQLNGRASLNGAVAGNVGIATTDSGAFLAALGMPGVALPQGLGQRIKATTDLTLTPDRKLALRDLVADLGGNTLRGAADVELNGVPQINAQLSAGALNLANLTKGNGPAAQGDANAAGAGWPTDHIDASGLASFNGAIALSADSIDMGALKLGASRTLLSNDRSRMVFELREVAAYGGRFTGQFVMNNRSGLSVGGAVQALGVQMKPLLSDLAGLTRFSGQGDAELSFLGVGQSVDAILRSLSGNGAVKVGRGTIEGIDLDALLGSFDVKGGTTVFDSLGAKFAIEKGVLRNDDLLLLLPNFNATGLGQINLGAQTLDYTVTPKALRVNGDRGLAVPVRIVGPWADPSIRPDLKAALDLNFAEEKAKIEAKIENKVKQKLNEELNLTPQDGQSLEDAVKNKVEDKLKQKLLRIFE